MPAKKGSKYLNAKTSSILSQYNHEDMQKLLNSGEFKSDISKPPWMIKYGKQYKSKKKKELFSPHNLKSDEKTIKHFKQEFAEKKQKKNIDGVSYNFELSVPH
jgi:hypothetical protein